MDDNNNNNTSEPVNPEIVTKTNKTDQTAVQIETEDSCKSTLLPDTNTNKPSIKTIEFEENIHVATKHGCKFAKHRKWIIGLFISFCVVAICIAGVIVGLNNRNALDAQSLSDVPMPIGENCVEDTHTAETRKTKCLDATTNYTRNNNATKDLTIPTNDHELTGNMTSTASFICDSFPHVLRKLCNA
ncbi:unnamed protein product [Owenia fusiformis]|uniref:Uncharacterized protein n=1 Tax=Owenia fusiformis TaxID=6347 RepID=A0A8S4Q7M0_OWEFU|nr:unnamed protein product [Owenia fusiformis]